MNRSKLLILCISILSLIGCNKSDEGKYEITVENSAVSVAGNELNTSIKYSVSPSAKTSVTAAVDKDWLQVAGVTASEINLVVSANNSGSERLALLTLSMKGAKDVFCQVVQMAAGQGAEIIPESKLVYAKASESDVRLNFNVPTGYTAMPKVTVPDDCVWAHVTEVAMDHATVHVDANEDKERAVELTISSAAVSSDAKVVLVQEAFLAKSTIRIPSAVMTVDCKAQSFESTYSVSGESAGQCVKAELLEQVPWFRVVEVTSSKISFQVDANAAEENRSAEVKLSLDDARAVYLTIVQKADKPFDINVKNVTSASATVSFRPKDETVTYAYSVETKALFEKYGSAAYIQAYLESLLEMAEENGVGLKDLLASGTKTVTVDKLKDDTEYYALAFDLDADGKTTGKVTILEFKTPKATPSENKFSFQVSAEGVVSVKTANDDPYIFDVWDIDSWNEFATPQALAERFVEYMKGFDGALETYTHRGNYTEDYKDYLTPGKNVAFAFGYKDGITTDVYFYTFDWE